MSITAQQFKLSVMLLLVAALCLLPSGLLAFQSLTRFEALLSHKDFYINEPLSSTQKLLRCLTETRCRPEVAPFFEKNLHIWRYVLVFGSIMLVGAFAVLKPQRKKPYHDRFATLGDVRAFRLSRERPYQIPLIKLKGQKIGLEHNPKRKRELRHIAAIAQTGAGKSVLAKEVVVTFLGSIVMVDIKGELIKATSGFRSKVGKVFQLDARGNGHGYNPFADIGEDAADIRAVAELLVTDPRDHEPIFAQRAVPAVYAALLGANLTNESAIDYLYKLVSGGAMHFVQTLAALEDEEIDRNLTLYLGMRPEDANAEVFTDSRGFVASAWGTLSTRLEPFFAEGIRQTMRHSDFKATDLIDETVTLYITWEEGLLESSARPLSLLLHGLITGINKQRDKDKRIDKEDYTIPALFLLDEASSYYVPSLPKFIPTMRSRGMTVMLFIQEPSQLEESYGVKHAKTILANCQAKLYFSISEGVAKQLSQELGFKSVRVLSKQYRDDASSITDSYVKRELMTAAELEQMPEADAIFKYTGQRPVYGQRLQWFKDKSLQRRMVMPAIVVKSDQAFNGQ